MSNKTYPICDVDRWKKFVKGEGEAPAGATEPTEIVLTKEIAAAVVKNSADMKKREVSIIFSTDSVDRDGDVIRQRGIDFAAYRENPVVLFAHNSRDLPVARSMKVFQTENRTRSVSIDRFTERDLNALGDTVFRMLTHETPFLNASSIGFRPMKWAEREVSEEERSQFYYPVEFSKIEKLEHSIVPVPANAEALQGAKSIGIDLHPIEVWAEEMLDMAKAIKDGGILSREHLEKCWDMSRGQVRSIVVPDVDKLYGEEPKPAEVKACPVVDGADEVILEFKGATPPDPSGFTAAAEDSDWTAPSLADFSRERFEPDTTFAERSPAARRAVATHFAWAEAMPPENYSQLGLPHHRATDSAAVLRGVNASIAVLNGARGGIPAMPDSDKSAVGRHLNRHRTVGWGLEALEIRAMDEVEIKALLERMSEEVGKSESLSKGEALEALNLAIDAVIAAPKDEAGGDPVVAPEVPAETASEEPQKTLDGNAESVDDAAQGSDAEEASFEFPSVRSEEVASKDSVESQLKELREGQRATVGLMKQLVELLKGAVEAEAEIEIEADAGDGDKGSEGLDDEVFVVLAADEDAESKKELTSADEVGRFIARETAEAVTRGLKEARGRLPN